MRLEIISIFPEYFAPLDVSLLGKARRRGLVDVHVHDLRRWTHDRHRTVDDTPYGGGPGMVMKPEPWGEALDTIAPPASRAPKAPPAVETKPSSPNVHGESYESEPPIAGQPYRQVPPGRDDPSDTVHPTEARPYGDPPSDAPNAGGPFTERRPYGDEPYDGGPFVEQRPYGEVPPDAGGSYGGARFPEQRPTNESPSDADGSHAGRPSGGGPIAERRPYGEVPSNAEGSYGPGPLAEGQPSGKTPPDAEDPHSPGSLVKHRPYGDPPSDEPHDGGPIAQQPYGAVSSDVAGSDGGGSVVERHSYGKAPSDVAGSDGGGSVVERHSYGEAPSDAEGSYGDGPLAEPARAHESGGARVSDPRAGLVPRLIVPTPSGRPFTQELAVELAAEPWLVFACGRYEGIDSRVVDEARTRMRVDEVSIGDYVLAGGEVAVLVIVEAISRLLPGVLGNVDSVTDDSFAPGAMEALLEGPVYTKPPRWRERAVPEILLSGNHGAIARWRRDQALRRTAANRPELIAKLDPAALDERDREVLREAGLPVDGEPMAH